MEGGLSQGKKVGGEEEAGGIGGSRLKSMWEPSVGARHYAQALPQSTALPHTQSPHAYAAPRVVPLPTGRSASLPSRAACQRQRRRGGRRRGVTRPRPAERGGPPPRWSPATPRRAAGAAARSPQTGHEAAAAAVAARLLPPPTPAAPPPPPRDKRGGGNGTGRQQSRASRGAAPPPAPPSRSRTHSRVVLVPARRRFRIGLVRRPPRWRSPLPPQRAHDQIFRRSFASPPNGRKKSTFQMSRNI